MKKRTNATQLPNSSQFKDVFRREAKRNQPKGSIGKHFVSLDAIDCLSGFPINTDFVTAEGIDDVSRLGKLFLENFIKELKTDSISTKKLNLLYDYLAELDKPQKADGIFVFGRNGDISRAVKGVELYKQGLAPKLILAGGHPAYKEVEKSEAEHMLEYALSEGVPRDDIIIETKSITISGNIFGSLNLFDEMNFEWDSMLLVMSPFAMRRSLGFFQKFTTDKKFIRVGSEGDKVTREKWFENEEATRYVMNEYVKLKIGMTTDTI